MSTTDTLKNPDVINATIITRSGKYFDFLNPTADQIDINDIAWGLANTCRFGGQCLQFYSVAQHSVHVASIVPPEHYSEALMHDAAEAYAGDIVRPLKQLLPDFKIVEDRIERVIADKYGLRFPWHDQIKHADLRLLRTEQRDLTAARDHHWKSLDQYDPLPYTINPLGPDHAAELFMHCFNTLPGKRAFK